MRKFSAAGIVLAATLGVIGCAGMLSVPDDNSLLSNFRFGTEFAQQQPCHFNAARIERSVMPGQGLDPESIALLNWNVYKGTEENWLADFLRLSQDSDIVALQEAQLHEVFRAGLVSSRLMWDLTTAFTYNDAHTGVMLASRIEPGKVCAQRVNEPLINIPKTAIVTEYRIKDREESLLVSNVHMINFTLGTEEYITQIRKLKEVLESHEGPLILTGDFNTWSDERMRIITGVANELGLMAVNYESDKRMTVFGNAVDHVYYRGLTSLKVYTEEVDSSDHNPIKVTFRLASL